MKTRKILALLLSMVMLFCVVTACSSKPVQTPEEQPEKTPDVETSDVKTTEEVPTELVDGKRGGVLNLAWKDSGSDSLDPYANSGWGTYIWSTNVFETAISRDANGNYVPCVCDFELSEDYLTLKLWVRDGVTFHNGNPVTIDDIVYCLTEYLVDTGSNVEKWFTNYIEDFTVDGDSVTFHFSEYNANTLYYISGYATFGAIMPAEILRKCKEADSLITDLNDIIGTGPYKLNVENTELGRVVSLDRYDGYVPVEDGISGLGGPKKAYMDTINVFFNSEENSIAMSMLSGDYDLCSLSAEFSGMLEGNNFSRTTDLNKSIAYICFNTTEGRTVADPNLRKAIAAAIDYDQLMEVLYGEGFYTLDNCPMDSSTPYATNVFSETDYYGPADLELAKSYLEQADYNGESIIIAAKSSDKGCAVIESMIEAAGINCEISYMDDSSFNAFYGDTSNDYDLICVSSAKCDTVPSSMVTNLRTRFWNDDEAAELFNAIGSATAGSVESMDAWKTMSEKWADDAHIITLGTVQTVMQHNTDLVINSEGSWRYFFNSYWQHPEEHMG